MSSIRRLACCAALFAAALGASGCTLVKPVVGAVTGPVYVLAGTGELPVHCGSHDGCGVAAFFAVSSIMGATAGLVTGVISDFRVLTGHSADPVGNWFNPFDVN